MSTSLEASHDGPLGSVLARLKRVARCGDGWEARCPAHDDGKASLTIGLGADGRVLLNCQKGCETADVLGAIGLTWRDLFAEGSGRSTLPPPASPPRAPRPTSKPKARSGRIVAQYDYRDEGGELLYQVVRFDPKDFRQRVPNAKGGWSWSVKGVRKVPYRLPEILAAIAAGRLVFVAEGEKDVGTLEGLGVVATCNAGGAEGGAKSGAKWTAELNEYFRGARVVIVPDNDEPGWTHAQHVAAQLAEVAAEVRLLELPLGPRLPKHGRDVSDWIAEGHTAEEFRDLVRQAPRWSGTEPPRAQFAAGEYLTDYGNARRLVRLHGEDLRYVAPWASWLLWDGGRWARDETGEVVRRAKQTALSIFHEAAEGRNAEGLGKHAIRSQAEARIRAMVNLAATEPEIPVVPAQLDTDDWALNALNGTIDLRTGELRAARREDLNTKRVPETYDPDATAPTWLAFLDRIFAGDRSLITFVQRAVGYSLTGSTGEQCLFFGLGTGANGKSTFLETISALMGDYASQIDCSSLTAQRQDATRNDLARLFGARFVAGVEWEDGQRLSEVTVKSLTGGDKITARFLFKEYFEFVPTFKLWVAANHKPVIRGTDHAIWRRIRLIPFNVTIPAEERDLSLREKLLEERRGILAWAVEGCLDWQAEGLGMPAAVLAATEEYREEMDPLAAFLDARCEPHPTSRVRAKSLWDAYLTWCQEAGETALKTQNVFGRRMRDRGLLKDHDRGGWYYVGLRLRDGVTDCDPLPGISHEGFSQHERYGNKGHNPSHPSQEDDKSSDDLALPF